MAVPPASGAVPPQSVPITPGNTGILLQLPPSLAAVQSGDTLEGQVTSRWPNATVRVETSIGTLSLRTALPLALNTPVLLRVLTVGEQTTVNITHPSKQTATGPAQIAKTAPTAVANIVTATVTRSLATGQTGIMDNPKVGASPVSRELPTATLSVLPAGTKLPVRVLSIRPPVNAGAAITGTAIRQTVPTPGPATSSATPSGKANAASAANPGAASHQNTPVKSTGAIQKGAPPSFTGVVKGTNIFGQPVIQSGAVELTLPAGRPMPTGGTLLLERIGLPIMPLSTGTEAQKLAVASRWEALYEALTRNASPATRAAVAQATPQPNAQLAGSLLFFMAALRGGDPRNWLGAETARRLEGDGLFNRIGEEFGVMQRLATEHSGQDWRMYLIPFLSDSQLQQLRLFVRGRPDEDDSDRDDNGIRFVIEATFSRLGPFQFDGLVQARNLSLVIRTERPVELPIRNDIMSIYATSLQALGFTGSVDFRAERFFEVQPLRESGLSGDMEVTA